MVGSWRHRTQRSTLYSCGPCVKTKRTCKHGRKNWAGFAWALTEPLSACGCQLVCSLIQRRLPLHFFWGLRYWKCARLGGQNLHHHCLSGSNFIFFFFFPGSSRVITLQNSLKDYARVSFGRDTEELRHRAPNFSTKWNCQSTNFDVSQFNLDRKTLHKSELWLFLSCRLLLFLLDVVVKRLDVPYSQW